MKPEDFLTAKNLAIWLEKCSLSLCMYVRHPKNSQKKAILGVC